MGYLGSVPGPFVLRSTVRPALDDEIATCRGGGFRSGGQAGWLAETLVDRPGLFSCAGFGPVRCTSAPGQSGLTLSIPAYAPDGGQWGILATRNQPALRQGCGSTRMPMLRWEHGQDGTFAYVLGTSMRHKPKHRHIIDIIGRVCPACSVHWCTSRETETIGCAGHCAGADAQSIALEDRETGHGLVSSGAWANVSEHSVRPGHRVLSLV